MAEEGVLSIHTDGASRGNPGEAAYAYVISRDGEPAIEEAGRLGEMTNNQAEYTALVRALEHALDLGAAQTVHLYSDSELMVKQMRGEYRVKNEELRGLYERARELADRFEGGVSFRHVRRSLNKRADELCNEALDGKREPSPRPPVAKKAAVVPRLRQEAVTCLREAGVPSPEEVWDRLAGLLKRHGVRLPPDGGVQPHS